MERKTQLNNARPLSMLPVGKTARLAAVDAGRNLNSRLASMGLVPGVQIRVISNNHPGPFMINVKGTRVMLGRGMAHKIMVIEAGPDTPAGRPQTGA